MALRAHLMSVAHQIDERARAAFRTVYGHAPGSVAVAPGRMNIVGEHTDYNEGFVLPVAIDRHVGVALRLRQDERVLVQSDRYRSPVELASLPGQRQAHWADYVLGVADEIRKRTGARRGFEAAIVSEVPVGSGLSSSGALEVAFALALLNAGGVELSPLSIAQLCQRAENHFVGARTGIMDQFTALQARAGNAMLLDCRSLRSEDVPLPDAQFSWLLVDTRVRHELAASGYNERRAECEAAARALGLASLRDAQEGDLDRLKDPVQCRRARHVVTENARVLSAARVLDHRSPRELGPILFASHMSLRVDFEVSCAELDCLVDQASGISQVVGARMMGGGFGGCALVLLESSGVDDVEQRLSEGYTEAFHQAPAFYRIRSVDGALPSAGS